MWMFNQIPSMLDVIFCIKVIIPYKLSSHVALLLTELYRFRLDLFRKIEPRRLSGNYFDMQEKPWAPNLSASTPSLFDEHIPHLPISRSSPFIRRGSNSKTVENFDSPTLFYLAWIDSTGTPESVCAKTVWARLMRCRWFQLSNAVSDFVGK